MNSYQSYQIAAWQAAQAARNPTLTPLQRQHDNAILRIERDTYLKTCAGYEQFLNSPTSVKAK